MQVDGPKAGEDRVQNSRGCAAPPTLCNDPLHITVNSLHSGIDFFLKLNVRARGGSSYGRATVWLIFWD